MDRPIDVTAYAGARGEERPLAVRLEGRTARVVTVLGRWVETGQEPREGIRHWFKVELEDGRVLSVYYDEALDSWFWREGT